jgi:hypothetical protein
VNGERSFDASNAKLPDVLWLDKIKHYGMASGHEFILIDHIFVEAAPIGESMPDG